MGKGSGTGGSTGGSALPSRAIYTPVCPPFAFCLPTPLSIFRHTQVTLEKKNPYLLKEVEGYISS